MRLSARWLAQFDCAFYKRYSTKPKVGEWIAHPGCSDPKCKVIKVRDRDEQRPWPKIY
jgi:hypothetical protein